MNNSDMRRVLGPIYTEIPNIGMSSGKTENLSQKLDKPNDEIRKMFVKHGIVKNANGSAYLEVGDTIIEVLIFGPRPIRGSFIERALFSVECKFLSYIEQPSESTFNGTQSNFNNNNNNKRGMTSVEQRISSFIESSLLSSIILEKYPKSTIDICITVISVDDKISLLNLINWAVNCSSVALVDSGIEIKDIVTSGQVSYNRKTNELKIDAINDDNSIDCVISFMNLRNDEIVGLLFEGDQEQLDEDLVNQLIDSCNHMSKKIRNNINSYLINSLN